MRTAYYIRGLELMNLIFAVLDVTIKMGLTRCYKTEGFLHLYIYICTWEKSALEKLDMFQFVPCICKYNILLCVPIKSSYQTHGGNFITSANVCLTRDFKDHSVSGVPVPVPDHYQVINQLSSFFNVALYIHGLPLLVSLFTVLVS